MSDNETVDPHTCTLEPLGSSDSNAGRKTIFNSYNERLIQQRFYSPVCSCQCFTCVSKRRVMGMPVIRFIRLLWVNYRNHRNFKKAERIAINQRIRAEMVVNEWRNSANHGDTK